MGMHGKSGIGMTSATSASGMVLLSVPTCMSMPSSPTPSRSACPYVGLTIPPPTASRTPPVILMEEDQVEEVMSIDLTSAHATLTTTSDPYWQLPSHMAEACRLEATAGSSSSSPSPSRRLNPPTKLEVTKVSPSSPCRSPLLQTGTCKVEPPPLKAEVTKVGASSPPEIMDISPK